jgi:hypothetical protein
MSLAGVLLLDINAASAHWTFPWVVTEQREYLCFEEARPLDTAQVIETTLACKIDLFLNAPGRRLRSHEHLSNSYSNEIRTGNFPASALEELCHGNPKIISCLFRF